MITTNRSNTDFHEEKIARLTEAAYRAILERGFRGSFLELELSLWETIRASVEEDDGVTVDAL